MRASILALLALLVSTAGSSQVNVRKVQPHFYPGLSLDIIDVQVDPGDVWADGGANAVRDCLTNPAYPDKTACKKLLDRMSSDTIHLPN
jgi:hypothetical protein